jgi:spore maturation protein CgeB
MNFYEEEMENGCSNNNYETTETGSIEAQEDFDFFQSQQQTSETVVVDLSCFGNANPDRVMAFLRVLNSSKFLTMKKSFPVTYGPFNKLGDKQKQVVVDMFLDLENVGQVFVAKQNIIVLVYNSNIFSAENNFG